MRYFELIRSDIDPRPLLSEIAAVGDAWSRATGRQEKIAVQREALAIPLRGIQASMIHGRKRRDVHESRWTDSARDFPLACALLTRTAEVRQSDLGRARIVCLPAGSRVYPHIDRGEYYRLRGRYHCVLKSTAGSWMRAGDEVVRMREGELWWFDNDQVHEAVNDGDEDRIHLIFDLLPWSNRSRVAEALDAARARATRKQQQARQEVLS